MSRFTGPTKGANMASIDKLTKAQLLDLIRTMSDGDDAPEDDGITTHEAQQFASLGFAVIGTGSIPKEGDRAIVPTKAGNQRRVALLHPVDTSNLQVEVPKGGWAFTYRNLKRGEK